MPVVKLGCGETSEQRNIEMIHIERNLAEWRDRELTQISTATHNSMLNVADLKEMARALDAM